MTTETIESSRATWQKRSAELLQLIPAHPERYRVLTGDRPTGELHIGHYFGSLVNRVRLQDMGVDTMVLVADYQVITDRDGVGPIRSRAYSAIANYLAIGIDPTRSIIFAHSAVPALNQLMLPLLSLVTDAELRRNPTVKTELEASGRPLSGLLLTYPVHQAADILFGKANLVPVGLDQLPHIEITRVLARRFDERYGRADPALPVFPMPDALLTSSGTILGTDGGKMSKSKDNAIEIGMSEDETARLVKKAVTDADRHITYEPDKRPGVSNLVMITALCTGQAPVAVAEQVGDGGAGALKKMTTEAINEFFAPIRARREQYLAAPDHLREVLAAGNARANERADATLAEVRQAMQMVY